jgi:hypothetical protein
LSLISGKPTLPPETPLVKGVAEAGADHAGVLPKLAAQRSLQEACRLGEGSEQIQELGDLRKWLEADPRAITCHTISLAEVFWEMLENSPVIINGYRSATISWGYEGDSIIHVGPSFDGDVDQTLDFPNGCTRCVKSAASRNWPWPKRRTS